MKISILTPSYNSGKYLERAIESVLQQDYNNWEHIVMDGGSTDNTVDILKKYPHIIYRSEKDKGQSHAMNKAFALSTGDIIVYLNADDYFEPAIFNLIVTKFKNENADFVVGKGRIANNDGLIYEWTPEVSYWKILLHYKYTFPLNASTYFYKRIVQETVGGFNEANHYTMDFEFLLSAYKKFKIQSVPLVLGTFFFDGNNKTATIEPISLCRATAIEFLKKNDWFGLLYYQAVRYYHSIKF